MGRVFLYVFLSVLIFTWALLDFWTFDQDIRHQTVITWARNWLKYHTGSHQIIKYISNDNVILPPPSIFLQKKHNAEWTDTQVSPFWGQRLFVMQACCKRCTSPTSTTVILANQEHMVFSVSFLIKIYIMIY